MTSSCTGNANADRCRPEVRQVYIFQEINPEAVTGTAFKRGLPRAGGGANLVEREHSSADAKNKAIKILLQSTRKLHGGSDKSKSPFVPMMHLANPKGVKTTCEMCSLPARMCCAQCGVTYYCCEKHKKQDWPHQSLCLRLRIIRGETDLASQKTERSQSLAQKNLVTASLVDEIFCNAMENVYEGRIETAVVEFQTCLTLIPQVYGLTSCEAITLFIAMSDAFLLENALDQALHSLAMATFLLRELEEANSAACLDYTRALLFKSQGKIDIAQLQYQDATLHFSECVYFSAEAFGGDHVRVCAGYFYLGKSLIASKKCEPGFSMLGFCTDLWTAYFEQRFMSNVPDDDDAGQQRLLFEDRAGSVIPRFLELEARSQLTGIQNELRIAELPYAIIKSTVCLGIIHFFNKKYALAKEYADSMHEYFHICDIKDPKLMHLVKRLGKHSTRRERRSESAASGP